MKHAESLIARILFLEGRPVVSKLGSVTVGPEVPQMFENDHNAELGAVRKYNAAVILSAELGDNATRTILEGILNDEDKHVDEIEENQDQIKQLGVQLYLSTKS
jgi:bacterioferritin